MDDLQSVYKKVGNEVDKAKRKIDKIDRIMQDSGDSLSLEYWYDMRAEAAAFLDGLYKAYDILFKAINK